MKLVLWMIAWTAALLAVVALVATWILLDSSPKQAAAAAIVLAALAAVFLSAYAWSEISNTKPGRRVAIALIALPVAAMGYGVYRFGDDALLASTDWHVESEIDEWTDSTSVFLVSTAQKPIQGESGLAVEKPRLVVYCENGAIKSTILLGTRVGTARKISVQARFDATAPTPAMAFSSGEAFAFTDANQVWFVKELLRSKRFRFKLDPKDALTTTSASFGVSGLRRAIGRLGPAGCAIPDE